MCARVSATNRYSHNNNQLAVLLESGRSLLHQRNVECVLAFKQLFGRLCFVMHLAAFDSAAMSRARHENG